jgi:hypothetical protein
MATYRRMRPCKIVIREITTNMVHWWVTYGGEVMGRDESYTDGRGRTVKAERAYLRMPGNKWCHYHQDGLGHITLHMFQEDSGFAMMFVMKWLDYIIEHNVEIADDQKAVLV